MNISKKIPGKKPIIITTIVIILLLITGFILQKKTNMFSSECEKAVSYYLESAKNIKIGDATVSAGNTVTVDYIGRLANGKVFDTSVEKVAKACGNYFTGRDYSVGLTFQAGAGQMIQGFDAGVQGMKLGETKTITIPYLQAYGARDEKRLLKMDYSKLPEAEKYKEGMTLFGPNGEKFKVYKIKGNEITFDTNHELAGKDLIFDITIKNIK